MNDILKNNYPDNEKLLKEIIEKDILSSYHIIYKQDKEGKYYPYLEPIFKKEEEVKENISTTCFEIKNETFEEYAKQYKEILCKNMKLFRENENITQKEMSEYCNLSKNHISAIERGMYACTLDCLLTYSYVLKKPISSFFTQEKEYVSKELNELILSLDHKTQQKLLQMLKIYISS